MTKLLKELNAKNLIHPPAFLIENTCYLVQMGSVAYGVEGETSDCDLYGICIPNKDIVFPHLRGEIPGFGSQIQRFEQWQEHHIKDQDSGREYDFSIYSIIKYFHLCMENNPNMIDSLFVPQRCILYSSKIGNHIRENRRHFLHKGAWHKFKGYSYSQLHKMSSKIPIGKREVLVDKYGYDVKFAYHVVRLLQEVEQILIEGDLNLDRNSEQLKSIRRGEWTEAQIRDWFQAKEKDLESAYVNSKLPHRPDEEKIKNLLLECLEMHWSDTHDIVVRVDKYVQAVKDIQTIIGRL